MKKKLIANLIIFIFCISCEKTQYQIEMTGFTMGTTYNIKMVTNNVESSYKTNLNNQIDSILHSINKQMSTIDTILSYKGEENKPTQSQIAMAKKWCELYRVPINEKCIYLN